MKTWPCDKCLVRVVCIHPCEDYINLLYEHDCINITEFGDTRYRYLYKDKEVFGRLIPPPHFSFKDEGYKIIYGRTN